MEYRSTRDSVGRRRSVGSQTDLQQGGNPAVREDAKVHTGSSSLRICDPDSANSLSKHTSCNRTIASRACSWLTRKVKFTLDDPNEIIETLMSAMVEKMRA